MCTLSGFSMNLYIVGYETQCILTLGELEFLTGFLLTEFLSFHHSWVPCQQTFWLKNASIFRIDFAHSS